MKSIRKKVILLLLTGLFALTLFAQNNPPVVENVSASQRTDGTKIVDVYYDVTDADGDTLTVSLQVSDDNGSTWTITPTDTLLSGDIGDEILSGTGKHIIWNAGDESVGFEGSQYKFKVTADDGSTPFEWCDVPAGDYTYGDPPQTLNIDYDFQIMKNEVTNTQYVTYLEEALDNGDITVTTSTVQGYYTGDEHWSAGTYEFLDLDDSDGRIAWTGSEFTIVSGYEDHPVVEVSWFGAWAFGEHYGIRLPTEHEWEKSARGNTGWDYPWGNSIDGSRANYVNSGDPFDNGTTPVGYYNGQNYGGFQTTDSPSPYGAYDMAGNVWDWTHSFYGGSYPTYRVVRGGSWYDDTDYLRSWSRASANNHPPTSSHHVGIRCVRTY